MRKINRKYDVFFIVSVEVMTGKLHFVLLITNELFFYIQNKNNDDDTSHSESSNTSKKNFVRRIFGKRIYSTIKRASLPHLTHSNNSMVPIDELLIIKRKLHNLKREKKAFRTVGLILGALLICWLPFFVTLPVMSILKHEEVIQDENTENTWFKIAFWLGYCNSAVSELTLFFFV